MNLGDTTDLLPIEMAADELDRQADSDAELAAQDALDEVQRNNEEYDPLEDDEEEGDEHQISIADCQQRIQAVLTILGDFKTLRRPGASRSDYISRLTKDVCTYYGYNEFLAEKFIDLFGAVEAVEFFEANETSRPLTIRSNSLRGRRKDLAQSLISNYGMNVDPVAEWSNVGLVVFDSPVSLGATTEYLAGHYMIQAASSYLPVMALQPAVGERILDMCAAPGGKSTYIAALMRNTGVLVANDVQKDRVKALVANIHRMGVTNALVCNHDGRDFPRVMGGFDRVLLDAPCSGTGVISKDASVKVSKGPTDFARLTHLQKELLVSAIDSIRGSGVVVYSTCAITVEENEGVIDYILRKRPNVKCVDTELPFGREGLTSHRGNRFHPSLKHARRYYPHVHNLDGFFVAKLEVVPTSSMTTSSSSGVSSQSGSPNEEKQSASKRATSSHTAAATKKKTKTSSGRYIKAAEKDK